MYITVKQLTRLIKESYSKYGSPTPDAVAANHNFDLNVLTRDIQHFAANFVEGEKYDSQRHPGDIATAAYNTLDPGCAEYASVIQALNDDESWALQSWAQGIIDDAVKQKWNAPPEPDEYAEYE